MVAAGSGRVELATVSVLVADRAVGAARGASSLTVVAAAAVSAGCSAAGVATAFGGAVASGFEAGTAEAKFLELGFTAFVSPVAGAAGGAEVVSVFAASAVAAPAASDSATSESSGSIAAVSSGVGVLLLSSAGLVAVSSAAAACSAGVCSCSGFVSAEPAASGFVTSSADGAGVPWGFAAVGSAFCSVCSAAGEGTAGGVSAGGENCLFENRESAVDGWSRVSVALASPEATAGSAGSSNATGWPEKRLVDAVAKVVAGWTAGS